MWVIYRIVLSLLSAPALTPAPRGGRWQKPTAVRWRWGRKKVMVVGAESGRRKDRWAI